MNSESYEKISNDVEMSFPEHVEEFRQRLFFSLIMSYIYIYYFIIINFFFKYLIFDLENLILFLYVY